MLFTFIVLSIDQSNPICFLDSISNQSYSGKLIYNLQNQDPFGDEITLKALINVTLIRVTFIFATLIFENFLQIRKI